MSTRRELYVYYRVAEPHWRAAADAVIAWQRRLCQARSGLETRLLRRPDPRDDQVTLMETYACADGIDATLHAELARGAPALQRWLCGERHLERFDPLD